MTSFGLCYFCAFPPARTDALEPSCFFYFVNFYIYPNFSWKIREEEALSTIKNMALKDEIINVAAPEKRHGPITGIEEIPKMQICFDLSNNTVSCDQR